MITGDFLAAEVLFRITYGMYIVSSRSGKKFNGLIVNTVTQVTSSPPRVSVTISRGNLTHDYIMDSGIFSISLLRKGTPMRFIGKWGFRSGRDIDKFQDTTYHIGTTGAPIVTDNALGFLEMRLVKYTEIDTHTIFIGEVIDQGIISEEPPLTYHHYHDVKGGRSSRLAPTFKGERS